MSPCEMMTLLLVMGCLVPGSALTDPCVNHTVLDQPWRSINCPGTECSGQLKCDENLIQGWYRFKSSGGWKIPETVVPPHHCSTHVTGWLQGSHPSEGEGEVTRTVCFNWVGTVGDVIQEIKIKNCSSYFVYELKPPPGCYYAYCTDPETAATEEPEEQSTRESIGGSSSTPTVSGTSEPMTSHDQECEVQSTRGPTKGSSSIPAGSGSTDSGTPSAPEESSNSQPFSDEDPQYKWINVKITSMNDLDDETAKAIVVERMKQMFHDECPGTVIALDLEDVECSASEPLEV